MRLALLAALVLATAPACRPRGRAAAEDSTFVATMSELRALKQQGRTDAASRLAVLKRGGFTEKTLEQAAREIARDPERTTKVWEAIEARPAYEKLRNQAPSQGFGAGPKSGRR